MLWLAGISPPRTYGFHPIVNFARAQEKIMEVFANLASAFKLEWNGVLKKDNILAST